MPLEIKTREQINDEWLYKFKKCILFILTFSRQPFSPTNNIPTPVYKKSRSNLT